ncbi:MAG: CRISPR-associated endonuclease Cas3'' [Dehalococcoidia bacterium]
MSAVFALWAKSKPPHALWRHLLDVGAVASEIVRLYGPVEGFDDRLVALLAALHDIGKADPLFQFQVDDPALIDPLRAEGLDAEGQAGTSYRHETRSSEWLMGWLPNRAGWSKPPVRQLRRVLQAHHGSFQSQLSGDGHFRQKER